MSKIRTKDKQIWVKYKQKRTKYDHQTLRHSSKNILNKLFGPKAINCSSNKCLDFGAKNTKTIHYCYFQTPTCKN